MKKDSLQAARSELARCVAPECAAFVREECGRWSKELDETAPSALLEVTDGSGAPVTPTKVTVDGVEVRVPPAGTAIELDPGRHVIEVTNGTDRARAEVVAERGKKNVPVNIALASAPPPPPPARRSAPLVLPLAVAGVGVAAIATSLVLGAVAKSELSDLDSCKGHCTQRQVDPIDTKTTISTVFFGVGVVALGVGVFLYLTRDKGAAWAPSSVVTF